MTTPILISNLTNIRYLTGLDMTAGVMLLTRKKRLLFADDRYLEKARAELKNGVQVFHSDTLKEHLKCLKRVRFEAADVTVARLKRWRGKFRGTKFIPSEGVIEKMRRQKRQSELRAIAKACRITDAVITLIPHVLRVGAPHGGALGDCLFVGAPHGGAPYGQWKHKHSWKQYLRKGAPAGRPYEHHGLTEKNLAWIIEHLARSPGADAMAFETIVAFGSNTSRPHHRPTERKLKKGDLVQIDMGVRVDGYCSDCSRVFFTGKPTEEQRRVHDLLVRIVKECTKRAAAGTTNRALDKLARTTLKKAGYEKEFLHGLGHGVGLEIHEGVSLSKRAPRQTLKTNEIITIEPGVYLEGEWGMRIEDTIIIGRNGGRRMTTFRY